MSARLMREIGALSVIVVLVSISCGRAPNPSDASPSASSMSPAATTSPSPSGTCTSADLPSARILAAFAYVPPAQQAVLFGGYDASNKPLNDTWIRRSGCWTQLHPAQNPPANTIAASAYDANTGEFVVLLYGASGGQAYLDLASWLWDGRSWRKATAPSPPVSAGQAAYDGALHRVILFGMADAGGAAQTWAWDGAAWSLLNPISSPIPRFNAAMVTDPATNKILLFGGASGATSKVLDDTWTWDGSQWEELTPQASPPPRQEATVAPFARIGKSILLGGLDSSGRLLNDAWQWDGATWSAIPSFGANCCSAAIDDGNEVVIFGGGSDHATNQTQLWNGTSWRAT